jgi:hypothetical protein
MIRYETPAFDPGIAFAWTLRSEQIARLRRAQVPKADRQKLERKMAGEISVAERAAASESHAFEPGIAFSWTLRAAEIARRQTRKPRNSKPDTTPVNILAAA